MTNFGGHLENPFGIGYILTMKTLLLFFIGCLGIFIMVSYISVGYAGSPKVFSSANSESPLNQFIDQESPKFNIDPQLIKDVVSFNPTLNGSAIKNDLVIVVFHDFFKSEALIKILNEFAEFKRSSGFNVTILDAVNSQEPNILRQNLCANFEGDQTRYLLLIGGAYGNDTRQIIPCSVA